MKKLFTIVFLFVSNIYYSQNIAVLKIEALENRIQNKSDTTYVINFWASWCVPCIKELPDFDSIYVEYKNKPVKILLVTLDFKEDLETKVLPFIKRKNIKSEVVLLDEVNGNYFIPKISDTWTGAIPATLIVNNKNQKRIFVEKKIDFDFLNKNIDAISKQDK